MTGLFRRVAGVGLLQALLASALVVSCLTAAAQSGAGKGMKNPTEYYFPSYDANGDGRLDRAEWAGRGNFDLLDTNRDGSIDRQEFSVLYNSAGRGWKPSRPVAPVTPVVMDPTVEVDKVEAEEVGKNAFCIITRKSKCPDVETVAHDHGLMPTGLTPVFPVGVSCPGIDETFALPYEDKTGKGNHGGIDIPVDFGTPILAVADGTVVLVVENQQQLRGLAITLRHSPQDTGLPFWTYTEYAHLQSLPSQQVGQRVSKGEIIGITGNTGVRPSQQGIKTFRRPGIHFAVYYTQSRRFAVREDYVIPEKPRWMDPMALYRAKKPFASQELAQLAASDKDISIPAMLLDGRIVPESTQTIWPYACRSANVQ